jgi:hypothetical protein
MSLYKKLLHRGSTEQMLALKTRGSKKTPDRTFDNINFQTRYQRNFESYTYITRVKISNGASSHYVTPNRNSKIQDGGLQTSNTCYSACTIDSNENPNVVKFTVDYSRLSGLDTEWDSARRNRCAYTYIFPADLVTAIRLRFSDANAGVRDGEYAQGTGNYW